MAENDLQKIDTPPVVTVRGSSASAPERGGHEGCPYGPVVIHFMKIGSEVMALEIGEDVLHNKRLARRQEFGQRLAVVLLDRLERGLGKQPIEDAALRIKGSFYIRYALVVV